MKTLAGLTLAGVAVVVVLAAKGSVWAQGMLPSSIIAAIVAVGLIAFVRAVEKRSR